jgi:hypothetical protein
MTMRSRVKFLKTASYKNAESRNSLLQKMQRKFMYIRPKDPSGAMCTGLPLYIVNTGEQKLKELK